MIGNNFNIINMSYINEDYNGVIIKLPSAFIKINDLESLLENFKKELEEKAKLSLAHPDYVKSLFELENYKDKEEFVKDKEKRYEESRRKHNELIQKYLNKEIIPCVFKDEKCFEDCPKELIIGDESINLYDYLYNNDKNKTLIRSRLLALNKKICSFVSSKDKYEIFMKDNGFIYSLYHFLPKEYFGEFFKIEQNAIYQDNYLNFVLRIKLLYVQIYIDDSRYYEVPIQLVDQNTIREDVSCTLKAPYININKLNLLIENIDKKYNLDTLRLIKK